MSNRKGIVLAGGTGMRLYPITRAVNKQLLPVYDKPMIFYPISILMLAGIREILVISTPQDLPKFRDLLGSGKDLGVDFSYAEQASPEGIAQALVIGEAFLEGCPAALILGDNLFFGHHLSSILQAATAETEGATVFAYPVRTPERYGVIEMDQQGNVRSLEEKPTNPRSKFAITGLYFYDEHAPDLARGLRRSDRGELEITDLNQAYLERGSLRAVELGRGIAWLDTGTPDGLLDAAEFIAAVERRQGLKVACLEEIALRRGWIGADDILRVGKKYAGSEYGVYLSQLLNQVDKNRKRLAVGGAR